MDANSAIENMIENPKSALFKLAIPTIVSFGCILLNLFFDSIWVSGLGNVEVSAVGIITPIFSLLIIIGTGIGTVVNISLSKSMAEKNVLESNSIIKNVIIVITVLSILIPLMLLPCLGYVFNLIGIKEIYYTASIEYLSILVMFIGAFFISDILPVLLKLQGLIKIPVYITVITSILNIILDPIFIYSFNLGIKGAAIATVISAIVNSILLIVMTYVKMNQYISIGSYSYDIKNDFKVFKENLRLSIPIILQSSGVLIFSIILNRFFIYEGLIYITAYSFSSKILAFAYLPLNAFSPSMLSIIGFLIGSGRWDDIKPNLKYALYIVEIFTIIPCIFLFLGSDFLSYTLYQTKDWVVINQISLSIKFLSIITIVQNGCILIDTMFLSIEKPEKSFIVIFIGIVIEIILMCIMEYNLHIVNSVYYILLLGFLVQIPIYYYIFRKDLNEFLNRKKSVMEMPEN